MSATMYGSTAGAGAGQAIFTDDVSLQVFMEHLKRLVRIIILSSNFMLIEVICRLLAHRRIRVLCARLDRYMDEALLVDNEIQLGFLGTVLCSYQLLFCEQNAMVFFPPSFLCLMN